MRGKKLIRNSTTEFLIFTGQAGEQSIEARYEDETLWLSQKLMAELFGVDVRTVSEHLKNIFASQELTAETVIRKFRITASDGKNLQQSLFISVPTAAKPIWDLPPGPMLPTAKY